MGVSTSPAQLLRKIDMLTREIKDTRRPLTAAAMAAKQAFIASEPSVVGHRVARGKVNVRYTIRGKTAIVKFTGPAHLALNPTEAHQIRPRRRRRGGARRALTINGDFAANADHPGTRGKDPGARRAKAAAAVVAPKAYRRVGITQPMSRIF